MIEREKMYYNDLIDEKGDINKAFGIVSSGKGLSNLIAAADGGDAAAQYIYAKYLDSTYDLTDKKSKFHQATQSIDNPDFRQFMEACIRDCVGNYLKSANQGNKFAQYKIGHAYYCGELMCPIVHDVAIEWFKKSASNGYAYAYAMLAFAYLKQNDLNESVKWCIKGAEKGEPSCQYLCFSCYENGEGVSKDHKIAVSWLKKSAQNGFEKAIDRCRQLGIDYSSKSGFPWFK